MQRVAPYLLTDPPQRFLECLDRPVDVLEFIEAEHAAREEYLTAHAAIGIIDPCAWQGDGVAQDVSQKLVNRQ